VDHPTLLMRRLEKIGASLAASGRGVALLALGSVGQETERLDEWSDLDFFAIVEPGSKGAFLEDLGWLTSIAPVAYTFRNTVDGYKVLYEDGVYCEFAVFEPEEMRQVAFAPGRLVWRREGVDEGLVLAPPAPEVGPPDVAWHLGEALTNLYVGLGRFHRGERLAAARLVQGAAVDRVLALAPAVEEEQSGYRDRYAAERRFEQRFPRTAARLAEFVPGYEHTPRAAGAILAFLDAHFAVEPAMKAAILALIGRAEVGLGWGDDPG